MVATGRVSRKRRSVDEIPSVAVEEPKNAISTHGDDSIAQPADSVKKQSKRSKTSIPKLKRPSRYLNKDDSKEKGGSLSKEGIPPPIVVTKPPSDTGRRKPWKVRLEGDGSTGILVPTPKQVAKGTGVLVTDFIIGKLGLPRPGARVNVIYEALFAEDGKIFDQHLSTKKPFVFRLGAAQVIRGLDLGMEGMRIGGAREIVIPPELGYTFYPLHLFLLYSS